MMNSTVYIILKFIKHTEKVFGTLNVNYVYIQLKWVVTINSFIKDVPNGF